MNSPSEPTNDDEYTEPGTGAGESNAEIVHPPRVALAGTVRRSLAASSTRRLSFPISSGRAPLGATTPARASLPIAGTRAAFGIATARRASFPISSGRAPLDTLAPQPAAAAVRGPLEDGTPEVAPTKESA